MAVQLLRADGWEVDRSSAGLGADSSLRREEGPDDWWREPVRDGGVLRCPSDTQPVIPTTVEELIPLT